MSLSLRVLTDQGLHAWLAAFWCTPPTAAPSPTLAAGRCSSHVAPTGELATLIASVLLHRTDKEIPS